MSDRLAMAGGRPVRAKFLPYARQTIDEDDVAAVATALRHDWITQGPAVARFEDELVKITGAAHAVSFANGTAALYAACAEGGFGAGDEVITTPLTFAATAAAIVARGARPVFADVDAGTLNLSVDAVRRAATARTRAVVAVDFAGLPCDYPALCDLASDRGWLMLGDAAHSFGGGVGERRVGTLADMTTLSFHPAKLITTGEGGAVLTDRRDLADRLKTRRHHGIRILDSSATWLYDIDEAGQNYRLTDFQCALGVSQLAKLDGFVAARARLAARYRARLAASPFVQLPDLPAEWQHAWHLFVVLLRLERLRTDRDIFVRALRAENIGATVHYPLLYRLSAFRDERAAARCPAAEDVARRLVTLPLFPSMTDADVDDVVSALDKVGRHFAAS